MSFSIILAVVAGAFLAFSNGANDNSKGVATLIGSKTTTFWKAMSWATLSTIAGSCAAFFLAQKLIVNFSGKGLVPQEVVQLPSFATSVALAAASTVFLATRLGFPISTTHAITGALVGVGFFASSVGVNFSHLFSTFFAPLLVSPFLAFSAAVLLYPLFRTFKSYFGVKRASCLCIGREVIAQATPQFSMGKSSAAMVSIEGFPQISFGTQVTCEERYVGRIWGFSAKSALDSAHFFSSGVVGFARGLNDTPKIAALLLVGQTLSPQSVIITVAFLMAFGGILMAKRVAETMSFQITEMNDGQGFTGNLVTSLVVLIASKFGLPVSTTHVSCGALFGVGTITKQAKWSSILKILLSWVITLPTAVIFGAIYFYLTAGINQ